MSASLNKVILIGNVGKDPVVSYLSADNVVATFPLATSERGYRLANGTEVPEQTEWHNIVMWGNLAKRAENYVRKGAKLYVEGKIRTRNYQDKKGITRYVTEILTEKFEIFSFAPSTAPQASADKNDGES
jgi:single-strand DNA-binding protein